MRIAVLVTLTALASFAGVAAGNECPAMAMGLQSGPCAPHATLLTGPAAGDAATAACDTFTAPLGAECCASLSAFAAAGCACDAPTLSLAALAGVPAPAIKGVLRGASKACQADGLTVSGPCFDAC